MSDSSIDKQRFVRECWAKAKVLSKFTIIIGIIFVVAAFRLYPYRHSLKSLFIMSVVMIFLAVVFHQIMKKAMSVLSGHPSDADIRKWGDFLELYYVPKYFIRKEKIRFSGEDEET